MNKTSLKRRLATALFVAIALLGGSVAGATGAAAQDQTSGVF